MKLSDTDIDTLLTDLSGKDAGKREKAERLYSENKAEILPQFFARLDKSVAYIEANKKWIVRFRVLSIVLGILSFTMVVLSKEKSLTLYFAFGLPCFLIAIYLIGTLSIRRQAIPPSYAYLLNLLNELDDPRFVGFMIDTMLQGNKQTVAIIEPILYRHLLLLRPSHMNLLHEKHHRYLREQLPQYTIAGRLLSTRGDYAQGDYELELGQNALVILTALKHIGTAQDIQSILLIEKKGYLQEVRDRAKQSREAIEQRLEEQKPRETLLRASENTGGQEELLRAANAQTETQSETLLRVPKQEP